jgi:hypothetical protein
MHRAVDFAETEILFAMRRGLAIYASPPSLARLATT